MNKNKLNNTPLTTTMNIGSGPINFSVAKVN